jgi:hypothetical protein
VCNKLSESIMHGARIKINRICVWVQRVIGTEHAQNRDIFILNVRRRVIQTPIRAETDVCRLKLTDKLKSLDGFS